MGYYADHTVSLRAELGRAVDRDVLRRLHEKSAVRHFVIGARQFLILGLATWGLGLLVLSLIARTLAIPQTMAATGLFYVAALIAAVGQICSHWLLFRTQLPL